MNRKMTLIFHLRTGILTRFPGTIQGHTIYTHVLDGLPGHKHCQYCSRRYFTQAWAISSPNRFTDFFKKFTSGKKSQNDETKKGETGVTESGKTDSELEFDKDQLLLTVESHKAERFEYMRKKVLDFNSSFIEQYSKDINKISKQSNKAPTFRLKEKIVVSEAVRQPVSATRLKQQHKGSGKRKKKDESSVAIASRFLLYNRGEEKPIYTARYEECRQFLLSQNIKPFELEFYPDIQQMSNNDLLDTIQKLKAEGIVFVYSLFLIQRMFEEIEEERKTGAIVKRGKLRTSRKPVKDMMNVQKYLHLCRLLDTPDLDPIWLLEQCAKKRVSQKLSSALMKNIESLKSVGISGKDIVKDISILKKADQKVGLYKQSNPFTHESNEFLYDLFMSPSLPEFQQKMSLSRWSVTDYERKVAKILELKPLEFTSILGNKKMKYPYQLAEKVEMCLRAGIAKEDIITYLKKIDGYPIEDFHAAIKVFNSSGFPTSLQVILNFITDENKRLKKEETSSEDTQSVRKKKKIKRNDHSTFQTRQVLFSEIKKRLSLSPAVTKNMFKCKMDIGSTQLTDVVKNLELLIKEGFIHDQLSKCPLVLVHPHHKVKDTLRTAESQIATLLNASSCPSTSPSIDDEMHQINSSMSKMQMGVSGQHDDELAKGQDNLDQSESHQTVMNWTLAPIEDSSTKEQSEEMTAQSLANSTLTAKLTSDPVLFLNAMQYLLEKEKNFSMGSQDHRILKTI